MDLRLAHLCACLAHLAYGDGRDFGEFQLRGRFDNPSTDTQGIFGTAFGDTAIFAFRGSEETGIADWITDLKFVKQVIPYEHSGNQQVRVHFGFIEAYKSVREAIQDQVKALDMPKLICTGHSLGAALAALAALDIQYNQPHREVSVYTFGSPKIGNKAFAESYERRVPQTYRLVYGNDRIPTVPPLGYEHVGELHRLGESRLALNSMHEAITDHLPHNYIQALREAIEA